MASVSSAFAALNLQSGTSLYNIGTIGQGAASLAQGMVQNEMAKADAAGERSQAKAQAKVILRRTAEARGAARAATAASGARVDEFSLPAERAIDQAGEMDAAMTILSGENRAGMLELQGRAQRSAGVMRFGRSIYEADFSGWRGAKFGAGLDAFYAGHGRSGD